MLKWELTRVRPGWIYYLNFNKQRQTGYLYYCFIFSEILTSVYADLRLFSKLFIRMDRYYKFWWRYEERLLEIKRFADENEYNEAVENLISLRITDTYTGATQYQFCLRCANNLEVRLDGLSQSAGNLIWDVILGECIWQKNCWGKIECHKLFRGWKWICWSCKEQDYWMVVFSRMFWQWNRSVCRGCYECFLLLVELIFQPKCCLTREKVLELSFSWGEVQGWWNSALEIYKALNPMHKSCSLALTVRCGLRFIFLSQWKPYFSCLDCKVNGMLIG